MKDESARGLAGNEGRLQGDAEPFAEFAVVGERAPDAGDGGFEFDLLFNAVFHLGNLLVAY